MYKTLVFLATGMMLAGCATDALFVGTYTRVGIDASADGAGGGIGIKNVAMTIAPTKASGEAYSVLGTSDFDLAFTKLALSEVIATGEAAECASSNQKTVVTLASAAGAKTNSGPLIFVASTSWSLLEVTWGDAVGPGISFGYRRTVGVRMPVKNETIGSTYSEVSISTLSEDHTNGATKTEVDGTRSVYTFATGKASVNMAQKHAAKLAGKPNDITIKGCPD